MKNGSKKSSTSRKIPVGTKIILPIGELRYRGTVEEDLGDLGVRGRRYVRVRVAPAFEGDEPKVLDWPLEELSVLKN